MKDLKHFVVDVHPEYPDTRCLFAIRNDGSREDFSIVKCIGKIEEKFSAWRIHVLNEFIDINFIKQKVKNKNKEKIKKNKKFLV